MPYAISCADGGAVELRELLTAVDTPIQVSTTGRPAGTVLAPGVSRRVSTQPTPVRRASATRAVGSSPYGSRRADHGSSPRTVVPPTTRLSEATTRSSSQRVVGSRLGRRA